MEKAAKHSHIIPKICVSGASDTTHCGVDALDKAKDLGRAIASSGAILLSPSTGGFPLWAAMGAKEVRGFSIGFSPAASEKEHVEVFRMPIDYLDMNIYTGFGMTGRSLLLIRSCDALIMGCGRVPSLGELLVALQEEKPIGILEGENKIDSFIKEASGEDIRNNKNVIFESDPKELVSKILEVIKTKKKQENSLAN
ncbi:hypothetical protein KC842_01495 [Candidatus Nomurabacteria bacterium]|nr:hypothetical protein [Candidatus Nomurabacteria bacterium]USN94529.1 MAG: LOG family protein [Candidatus Nomurabacteria bacterium]